MILLGSSSRSTAFYGVWGNHWGRSLHQCGKSWKEAKLQTPVHTKAHTRFTIDWVWNGEETVIMSRSTDDTGDVQPSRAELYKNWGVAAEDLKKPVRTTHFNAIQPWKVARDGSIQDAMFA